MKWLLVWILTFLRWLFGPRYEKMPRWNPRRYAKNRMMREGGLSARQWRKFRKQKKREAKEVLNGTRSA